MATSNGSLSLECLLPNPVGILDFSGVDDDVTPTGSVTPATPVSLLTESELINEYVARTARNRCYRGRSPSSMLVTSRVRVRKDVMRVEIPWETGKQQASTGKVKAFKAQPHLRCCKRKCAAMLTEQTTEIKRARQPLFDSSLSRENMRAQLLDNAEHILLHPTDNLPVCMTMATVAYSCSRAFLWPNTKRNRGSQGDSNRRRATKVISIMEWFQDRKRFADIMPDTGIYQLSEPTRRFVLNQYKEDVKTIVACDCPLSGNPEPCHCPNGIPVYIDCCPQYFYDTWSTHFPEVKVRKHCRFSKCSFCILQRQLRDSHTRNRSVVAAANARLEGHYKFVKHERTVHTTKVKECRLDPTKTLCASMDGTSQLRFGLPSFKEISKLDCGNVRIQNHLEIVEVAGSPDRIYVYTVPEDIPGNANVTVEVTQRFLKVWCVGCLLVCMSGVG